jgi:hypothetical protein
MFNGQAIELLTIYTSLDPKDLFSLLKIDVVCTLTVKLYTIGFRARKKHHEAPIVILCTSCAYKLYFPEFDNIGDHCCRLAKTRKSDEQGLFGPIYILLLAPPLEPMYMEKRKEYQDQTMWFYETVEKFMPAVISYFTNKHSEPVW